MRRELSEALCFGRDVVVVGNQIKKDLEKTFRGKAKSVDEDVLTCQLIQRALTLPEGSSARQLADRFMRDFEKIHNVQQTKSANDEAIMKALLEPVHIDDNDETEGNKDGSGN